MPKNAEEFRKKIKAEWENLDSRFITKVIHEVPARLDAIIDIKGQQIPAWWKPSLSGRVCRCPIRSNVVVETEMDGEILSDTSSDSD